MKKLTCRELDGACDTEITGNTAEEMAKNSREHAMSANDEAHKSKMKQMGEALKGPDDIKKYMDDFRARFDALPDA